MDIPPPYVIQNTKQNLNRKYIFNKLLKTYLFYKSFVIIIFVQKLLLFQSFIIQFSFF